jgi:hypothetical protein
MKQDNTNDTERLRYQDVNLRRAIQRRQQRAPQLPADFSLHSRKHVTRWHRMAAAFIGFIIISGLAFAAYFLHDHSGQIRENVVEANHSAHHAPTPAPVHFSNARLDSILTVVARHEHRAVSYHGEAPRSLRFTITWNPDQPLADFLATVNEFEGLRLTDARDTIFVEQTAKESQP